MVKSNIIITAIVGILLASGLLIFYNKNMAANLVGSDVTAGDEVNTVENNKIVDKSKAAKNAMETEVDEQVQQKQTGYIEFSPEKLNQPTSVRRVLYFYANWCSTCKVANDDFMKNFEKLPDDVVVIRVNYNDTDTDQDEKDLAKKYGITYQHTFVQIDENGEEITKWNGGEIDELLSRIK